MATLYKIYRKLPEGASTKLKPGTEIRMTISFNKTPNSWVTSKPVDVGYRVSVVPVQITEMDNGTGNGGKLKMEEFGAFTGFNDTLLECSRMSPKRLEMAIETLNSRIDKYMQYFVESTETI